MSYLRDTIAKAGVEVKTINLSTHDNPCDADVSSTSIAAEHPGGPDAIFAGDRAVTDFMGLHYWSGYPQKWHWWNRPKRSSR